MSFSSCLIRCRIREAYINGVGDGNAQWNGS